MKKADFSIIIFIILTIGLIFLGINSFPENVVANGINDSLIMNNDFETYEFSQISNSNENVTSVGINLPSDLWNIKDVELNFSNILEVGKEVVNIEDKNYTGIYRDIYFQNAGNRRQGLGVQIQLNKSETLYGVYIYGKKVLLTYRKIIQVQIRGCDPINNKPNNTIYLTMDINMSTQEGWYLQNFSSPLTLQSGIYYLVLNGTNIIAANDDRYHWYYNNNDPTNPSLNISQYDVSDTWSDGIPNSPYLYKIIREYETSIYPENVNMTVEIDNKIYNISNEASIGYGHLLQTNINYFPSSYQVNFPVYNNRSGIELKFNVNYILNLNNTFFTPGSVLIKLNETNRWELNPTIIRKSSNQSVKLYFPLSWQNISINKDLVDITSNVTINPIERFIFFPNDIISDGAFWNITASSANVNFDLYVPSTEFNTGQELEFSLNAPILSGNYTFILFNALGFEDWRISKQIPPESNVFSYTIPSNEVEGTHHAFIFFFNGTDAGVQYQQFNITVI
ncbi:MAG: hypothetical protein ACFE8J_17770, partial [Candidatus Heimdallarchaeota archaeon]